MLCWVIKENFLDISAVLSSSQIQQHFVFILFKKSCDINLVKLVFTTCYFSFSNTISLFYRYLARRRMNFVYWNENFFCISWKYFFFFIKTMKIITKLLLDNFLNCSFWNCEIYFTFSRNTFTLFWKFSRALEGRKFTLKFTFLVIVFQINTKKNSKEFNVITKPNPETLSSNIM